MKIAMIGTGAYSLGLGNNIKAEMAFWTESKEVVKEFKKTKKLDSIIKGVKLPKDTLISNDLSEVIKDAEIIFLLTSSKYIESICDELSPLIKRGSKVLIGTKGILDDGVFIHDMVRKHLHTKKICNISGPSFADDLIKKHPIGLNIGGDYDLAKLVTKNVFNPNILLKYTEDIEGLELCGAIKNVFAIGSGIIYGMKNGDSTNAFYITRLFTETKKVLKKLDCYGETMYSYAGLGDLILTCTFDKSRNFNLGKLIGAKKTKEVKKYLKENTCEGYYTLDGINDLFNKKRIYFPIINALHEIAFEDEDPSVLTETLLSNQTIMIIKPKKKVKKESR